MPKPEERTPWALSKGAAREPYPRKNLYFVGDYMDEVYDYCIWRANVDGYITLDGTPARGSSDFITDQLVRLYLQSMLEPDKAIAFSEWRRKQYSDAGMDPDLARVHPNGVALSKNLQGDDLSEELVYIPGSDSFAPTSTSRKQGRKSKLARGQAKKKPSR